MPMTMDEMAMKAILEHPELIQSAPNGPAYRPSTVSPDMASVLGAAADGVSTYKFLHEGSGQEGNVMLGGKGAKPAVAGLSAAGMGLGMMGMAKLLARKWPRVGRALQGGTAGRQLAIGLTNLESNPVSSDTAVGNDFLSAVRSRR